MVGYLFALKIPQEELSQEQYYTKIKPANFKIKNEYKQSVSFAEQQNKE